MLALPWRLLACWRCRTSDQRLFLKRHLSERAEHILDRNSFARYRQNVIRKVCAPLMSWVCQSDQTGLAESIGCSCLETVAVDTNWLFGSSAFLSRLASASGWCAQHAQAMFEAVWQHTQRKTWNESGPSGTKGSRVWLHSLGLEDEG